MGKYADFRDKFFRDIYNDMVKRINQYQSIQRISNEPVRKRREGEFLAEQREVIKNFISKEEKARSILNKGLKLQQKDIESWWKRNIEFRRVKHNCMDRFDNLIAFAKKSEEILAKDNFGQKDSLILISEIEDEIKTMIHLSDEYSVKKYGYGILAFCQRNKSPLALAVLFLSLSSLAVYMLSNYNIVPRNTQTTQISFTLDDMRPFDWAQGAHYSYGFHTMLDRVVQHKSNLAGLQYNAYEDKRYGNTDANILEVQKGASLLIPDFMSKSLGDNIMIEVQALNRGETVIVIFQNNQIVLNIRFNQDKIAMTGANTYNYSNSQLKGMYHAIRLNLERLVNSN